MRRKLQQELIYYLSHIPNLSVGEFYYMLASILTYFEPALKHESWNTFSLQIEKNQIPLQTALFMTDEEKLPYLFSNPKISKKQKQEALSFLFEQQKVMKDKLEQKKIWEHSRVQLVFIPDDEDPPCIFPLSYLKENFLKGSFINELSGKLFSKDVIDAILKNKYFKFGFKQNLTTPIPNAQFLKLFSKELVRLDRITKDCWLCKKKQTQFKTLRKQQLIRFCSLTCLNEYEHHSS